MPLTETKIKKLPRPSKYPKLHADRDGLYLKHTPAGLKTWVYRTRKGGRWTVRKLGEFPAIPLNVARSKVSQITDQAGHAPLTRDVVDEFWRKRIEPRYRRTNNVRTYANRLTDRFGSLPIDQLTTRALADDLKTYADRAPVAANRCLAFWKLVMRYAIGSGYIQVSPLQETSAVVVGGEEKSRDVTLTDDQIQALWQSDHKHAPLLRALLLTGCRISELQSARVEHLDGDRLHIPDNKSKRPHWVAITPTLRDQFGDWNGYLFEKVSPTAVQSRLRREGTAWRPHDLRRTFASIAAKTQPMHVLTKCLNHSMPGALAVYNRHDYEAERAEAAADIEAYVLGVAHG